MNTNNLEKIKTDRLDFDNNIDIIFYYDQPLIYIGTNKYNEKFLSIIIEDTTNIIQYINIFITDTDINNYKSNKITTLELMKQNELLLWEIKNTPFPIVYKIEFSDIPQENLPDNDSYYNKEKTNDN